MAKLYITEYAQLGTDSIARGVFAPEEPAIAEQVVTFTTTTQSSAFNVNTRVVRVHVDAIASLAFGTNPTATTNSQRFTAGQTEYKAVRPDRDSGLKVAAVTNI